MSVLALALVGCTTPGGPTGSPSPTVTPTPTTPVTPTPTPPVTCNHDFSGEVAEARYLCDEATCESAATYYKSCTECGEASDTDTFVYGDPVSHSFTAEVVDEDYLVSAANCKTPATYYKSCIWCGEAGTATFTYGTTGSHVYDQQVAKARYKRVDATCEEPAQYVFSCVCGLPSEDDTNLFESGAPKGHNYTIQSTDYSVLASEYAAGTPATYYYLCECGDVSTETYTLTDAVLDVDSSDYVSHNVTALNMSMYDTTNLKYGYNWVTTARMYTPVLMIKEAGADEWSYYAPVVKQVTTWNKWESAADKAKIPMFTYKVVVPLEENTAYVYKVMDLGNGYTTDEKEMTSVTTDKTSFSFTNITDTQDDNGKVTKRVMENANFGDFILHTGDVVESGKHIGQWQSIIDGVNGTSNRPVVDAIPYMALPGNHDTTYKSDPGDYVNYFNYNIPEQDTTLGCYYSFTYGNAKFIMLNTNLGTGTASVGLGAQQTAWLENELATNDKDWLIVSMHHAVWSLRDYVGSPSSHYADEHIAMRSSLSDMFAQYGVDLVIQAHGHTVEKTFAIGEDYEKAQETFVEESGVKYSVDPQGVIYCQNGTSANQAYNGLTMGTDDDPDMHVTNNPYSGLFDLEMYTERQLKGVWAEIEIDNDTLTVVLKCVEYDFAAQEFTGNVNTLSKWGIKKTLA